jgi:arylsulfatase A-like enzyme
MSGLELDWGLHDLAGAQAEIARHPDAVRRLERTLGVSSAAATDLILRPEKVGDHAARGEAIGTIVAVRAELHRRLPYQRSLAGFLTGVRDHAYPRALYAGEVSYVDAELDRLRRTLDDLGIAGRTVLVATADHGEGFGEHGIHFNHLGLFEEMIRVPLVVWAPGRLPAAVRADPVAGVDVAPTMLRLAGVEPGPEMQGRDLFATDREREERPVVVEADEAQAIAIRRGNWKLVRHFAPTWVNSTYHRDRGDTELYDLAADRGERMDQAAVRADVARDLAARLDAWLAARGIAPDGTGYGSAAAPVDPDVARRLRELGYVE